MILNIGLWIAGKGKNENIIVSVIYAIIYVLHLKWLKLESLGFLRSKLGCNWIFVSVKIIESSNVCNFSGINFA